MYDPGLSRHEWESEMASIDDDVHDDPAESLSELDDLLRRMLEETGFDIADPVVREGDEREVVAEYLAAREITLAYERGSDELSPGDVAAAINDYRELFDYLIAERSSADPDIADAAQNEPRDL
jgi:hypothetical protein